jgi:hypothetical protein
MKVLALTWNTDSRVSRTASRPHGLMNASAHPTAASANTQQSRHAHREPHPMRGDQRSGFARLTIYSGVILLVLRGQDLINFALNALSEKNLGESSGIVLP